MKYRVSTVLLLCSALFSLNGCVTPPTPDEGAMSSVSSQSVPPGPVAMQKTISYSKIIDLSHTIAPDIPLWPGDPPVVFTNVADFATDGYFLRNFSMGEHSGTHMNAPSSFKNGADGIDTYDASSRVLPAVVIDVRARTTNNPDYALTKADLLAWEGVHGLVPAGSLVLLYTGWQEKWGDPVAFFNQDANGALHFPGFAGATTTFLLQQRSIAGVGIDTHGADPGLDQTYATNTQVLKHNGIVLECVANLDKIPATGATLVLGILKLKGGSGSPLSVMAFAP